MQRLLQIASNGIFDFLAAAGSSRTLFIENEWPETERTPLRSRLITASSGRGSLVTCCGWLGRARSRVTGCVLQRFVVALALAVRGCAQSPASVGPANAANDPRTLSEKLALFDLTGDPQDLANVYRHHLPALVYYALPSAAVSGAYGAFLNGVASARVDQQLGATGANAVAKAGLTTLASFALESGVLTETTAQNVATLHANADGLMRFLTNREVAPLCASNDTACQPGWAKDLDLSASFTANRFESTAGRFESAANRFESATVSYAIANPRDIRSPEYRAKWLAWFDGNHAALRTGGQDLLAYVGNLIAQAGLPTSGNSSGGGTNDANLGGAVSRYDAWRKDAEAAIAAVPGTAAERAAIFAAKLDGLIAMIRGIDPQFDVKLADLERAYMRSFTARGATASNRATSLVTSLITAPQWLVQATYTELPLEPRLINARLVYAQSPRGASSNTTNNTTVSASGSPSANTSTNTSANTSANTSTNPGTFTVNTGVDLYEAGHSVGLAQNSVPETQPGAPSIAQGVAQNTAQGIVQNAERASRFRDAQAAIEFDRAFGATGSPAALSVGAYYQYQPRPAILVEPGGAETWADVRGSLFLIQAGITLTIAGTGVKVPIGVSWSNRMDLARGQELRAHFGFTFDSGALVLSK